MTVGLAGCEREARGRGDMALGDGPLTPIYFGAIFIGHIRAADIYGAGAILHAS